MNNYFDLSDLGNLANYGITEFQLQERYTGIALTYFAKLFGEIIFLDWKKNKNGSYSFYIHDRENIEGVYEIRYDVFAIIMNLLKKMKPKYFEELTNKYMNEVDL